MLLFDKASVMAVWRDGKTTQPIMTLVIADEARDFRHD